MVFDIASFDPRLNRLKMGDQLVSKIRAKLRQVTNTQDSVRLISLWLIKHKDDAQELANVWRDEVQSADPKRRLLLLYVANDVIQTGRKRAPSMKAALQPYIRDALAMSCKDTQIKSSIVKMLKVWADRGIFSKSVLSNFDRAISGKSVAVASSGSATAPSSDASRKSSKSLRSRPVHDFKVASLSEVLNNFKQFSAEVALKHAALAGIRTDVRRSDIASNVKDRTTGGRLQEELEEARAKLTDYCDSVNVELQDRRHLLHTLETGLAYHQSRLMQAKAIQEEFSTISKRVKHVRERLADKIPTLPSAADQAHSPVAPAIEELSPERADTSTSKPYDPVMDIHEVADMELDQSDEEPPEPSPQPSPCPQPDDTVAMSTMTTTAPDGRCSPSAVTSMAQPVSAQRPSTAYPTSPYSSAAAGSVHNGSQVRFSQAPSGPSSSNAYPDTTAGSPPPSPGIPEDDDEPPPGPDEEVAPVDPPRASKASSNMLTILTRMLGQQKASGSTAANTDSAGTAGGEPPSASPAKLPSTVQTSQGEKPLNEILESLMPTLMDTLQKVQAAGPGGVKSSASVSSTTDCQAVTSGPGDLSATGVALPSRPQPFATAASTPDTTGPAGIALPLHASRTSGALPLQAFQAISSPSAITPLSSTLPQTAGLSQTSYAPPGPDAVPFPNAGVSLPPPPPGMPRFPPPFLTGPPQPPCAFPPPGLPPTGFSHPTGPPMPFVPGTMSLSIPSVDSVSSVNVAMEQSVSGASDVNREGDETPPLEELEAVQSAPTPFLPFSSAAVTSAAMTGAALASRSAGSMAHLPLPQAHQQVSLHQDTSHHHHQLHGPRSESTMAMTHAPSTAAPAGGSDGMQHRMTALAEDWGAPAKRNHGDTDHHAPLARRQPPPLWRGADAGGRPMGPRGGGGYFETGFDPGDQTPPWSGSPPKDDAQHGNEWPSW